MANKTGPISVNLVNWNNIANEVSASGDAISADIEVELSRNDFTRLENLAACIVNIECAVNRYVLVVNQEAENMRAAGIQMQEQDQENQAAFSNVSGG